MEEQGHDNWVDCVMCPIFKRDLEEQGPDGCVD